MRAFVVVFLLGYGLISAVLQIGYIQRIRALEKECTVTTSSLLAALTENPPDDKSLEAFKRIQDMIDESVAKAKNAGRIK